MKPHSMVEKYKYFETKTLFKASHISVHVSLHLIVLL